MDNGSSTALPERWVFNCCCGDCVCVFFCYCCYCARGKTIDREGVDRFASRLAVPSCLRKRNMQNDDAFVIKKKRCDKKKIKQMTIVQELRMALTAAPVAMSSSALFLKRFYAN